jgi:serine/threonine protein kinase
MVKMVGTMTHCAPESFQNLAYTIKSDVYSIGITLWEIVTRCINNEYQRPYEEYPNLKLPVQIIMNVATKNLRPTVPPTTPEPLKLLIEESWDSDPNKRPDCPTMLKRIEELQKDLAKNPVPWAKAIKRKWVSATPSFLEERT